MFKEEHAVSLKLETGFHFFFRIMLYEINFLFQKIKSKIINKVISKVSKL